MTASRRLFLLGLGLCVVISHSLSGEVKVYGGDTKNQYEDVTWQLEKQRKDKQSLETLLEKTTDAQKRSRIQKDIDKITSTIGTMEVKFRVVYRDHIEALQDNTQNLENEKAEMKKELEAAEERHAKVVADMQEAKNEDFKQIGAYQAKLAELEESTNQMKTLQRDYAAIKEIQNQQLDKEKEENERLIKVKDELTRELQHVQNLHAEAMVAMSMSLSRGDVKPSSLPYEQKIIAFRNDATTLRSTKDKRKRLAGFNTLQKDLKALYKSLYNHSKLPNNVSLQELERRLNIMKANAKNKRIEQTNRRTALLDQIQKKNLRDYTEKEIEALQEVNKQVQSTDGLLKHIAERKTFVKAMKEVALLIKESTDTANYAK